MKLLRQSGVSRRVLVRVSEWDFFVSSAMLWLLFVWKQARTGCKNYQVYKAAIYYFRLLASDLGKFVPWGAFAPCLSYGSVLFLCEAPAVFQGPFTIGAPEKTENKHLGRPRKWLVGQSAPVWVCMYVIGTCVNG